MTAMAAPLGGVDRGHEGKAETARQIDQGSHVLQLQRTVDGVDVLVAEPMLARWIGSGAIDANCSNVFNQATVTTADIETSNGVIHVIDAVLLP